MDKKPSFYEQLRARVDERFGELPDEAADEIHSFAKEVALESWKNGLSAARRKSPRSKS